MKPWRPAMPFHRPAPLIAAYLLTMTAWGVCSIAWARPRDTDAEEGRPQHRLDRAWFTVETIGDVPRQDLDSISGALERGAASLMRYFEDPRLEALMERASVRFILHAAPNEQANETTATTLSGFRSDDAGSYFAEIHMLAPSSHAEGLTTSIGEPKDAEYFDRLAVHELSTVPLELATRLKPGGWRLRTAPAWFVQGYEEFLGMTSAPADAGKAALDLRTAFVAADPGQVDDSFGLDVRDPYVTGAVLLRFMHERYGAERVRAILTSTESTFGRAARASLGVSLEQFMGDWRAWIGAHAPPP